MMTWLRENWRLYHIRCEIRSEIKGIGNVASYWVSSWDSWLLLSYLSWILRGFLVAKIVRLVMGVESCEGCFSTRYVIYTITLYAVLLLFDFFVVLWNDPFHVSTPVDVICKGKVISSLSWNRVCRVENYSSCVGKTMWWTCTQTGWSYVGSSEPVDKINNIQWRKNKQSTKTCLALQETLTYISVS